MWDLDCTPGRLSSESTSSSKGQLFVSFILKGKSLDLTRPDGNPYAKAAGLFIVLQQGLAAFGKSVIKFGEWSQQGVESTLTERKWMCCMDSDHEC